MRSRWAYTTLTCAKQPRQKQRVRWLTCRNIVEVIRRRVVVSRLIDPLDLWERWEYRQWLKEFIRSPRTINESSAFGLSQLQEVVYLKKPYALEMCFVYRWMHYPTITNPNTCRLSLSASAAVWVLSVVPDKNAIESIIWSLCITYTATRNYSCCLSA